MMGNGFWIIPMAVALLAGVTSRAGANDQDDVYRAEVERWRRQREAELKADDGWLTVAGLFWVKPGETTVGSDPSCDVVLPQSGPSRVGLLTLSDEGKATFKVEPGVTVTRKGRPFVGGAVRSDAEGGTADVLAVGDLRLILIKRGARHAFRLKDNRSAIRSNFAGLKWFPVEPAWKVRARFVPDKARTRLVFDTIVGEPEAIDSPGFVEFERDGQSYRLQAASQGAKLWFVFRDATSGRTTHPGARQLSAEPPDREGYVTLDFNKAINLPCAFTPYATCPLAPPQNRLTVAVTAGEMKYQPREGNAAAGE
jgi:uncharacterized protein (DUF1684 family)